ncbi:MAG: hypothetical protein RL684_791, partial [Pseudomonadota bacterium]
LCDSGAKYLSRLFNPEWLAQKGLLASAEAGYGGTLPLAQFLAAKD